MTHFHVGNNLPGCLPTSSDDGIAFTTWQTAKTVLREDLEQAADWEQDVDLASRNLTELSDMLDVLNLALPPEFEGHAAGRVWWIVSCKDEECKIA